MLATISILTAFAFAAIYPLCFWLSADDPLRNNFHKFHIGLPNTIGGVVFIFVWLMDIPLSLKILVTIWKTTFLSVSWFSWKKEFPSPRLLSLPSVLGIYAFIHLQAYLISPGWTIAFMGVLGGLIFCSSLYAMNLGHWYLNVHGLPVKHLARVVYVFAFFLLVRLLWDAYALGTAVIIYKGDNLPLIRFVATMDGFLLIIGIFFGALLPFLSLYFVKEVLKLKNTQSATGMLYVLLCSVLIGDIAYKYYLIKFGIVL